jgi:Transmembrane protein 131-like N-terminal
MAEIHGGYMLAEDGKLFADQLQRRQEIKDALLQRGELVDFWPPELKFGSKPISRAAVGTVVLGNDSPSETLVVYSVSTDSDSFSVYVPAWLEVPPNAEYRI